MGLSGTVKGLDHRAFDYFTNMAARTGFGTPNLAESADYELIRFSYDYWKLITLYRNHWISRRIVDVPAQDMVKAWPKLTSDIEPKQLTKIDRAIRKTQMKGKMLTALQWARLFGGAGALMVIEGQEDVLDEPLDLDDVPLGGFKGIIPFDRWAGISPGVDICTDINRPVDFGLPEYYDVRNADGESFRVHSSRLMRFTGPTVPTPEKEAQSLWGISVLELAYEEIKKRDNMSWNILNLTFRANIIGMRFNDLAQLLSGLGSNQQAAKNFEARMSAVNHAISNQSMVPLPADGGIEAVQYSFAGLSECYQQFQLDTSGSAEIPVTRLWGRTITGLGQSNDADERIYEEKIAREQDVDLRPQLEKVYPVICMSELGEVPDDLDLNFPSVRVLDEKEKAELAKTVADTISVHMNGGLMSARTAAKEVKQSSDITGIGTNLTDEDIAKLPDDVPQVGELGTGLFGGMEGEAEPSLDPASSPSKVLKMQNKAKESEKAKAADSDGPAVGTHRMHGMTLVVETPKGGTRSGKGWAVEMPADYGYIDGIEGADGDSLDCYVGDGPSNGWIYVIDQRHLLPKKGFDEHKCMVNFPSWDAARDAYMAGHHRSNDVIMDWTPMRADEFRQWTRKHDMRKPAGSVRE